MVTTVSLLSDFCSGREELGPRNGPTQHVDTAAAEAAGGREAGRAAADKARPAGALPALPARPPH